MDGPLSANSFFPLAIKVGHQVALSSSFSAFYSLDVHHISFSAKKEEKKNRNATQFHPNFRIDA